MLNRRKLTALFLGLLATAAFVGCGGGNGAKDAKGDKKAAEHADDHAHPSDGPHKGHLIELGKEEYHAELCHDDATHTVTVYVLDSAAKKAVPIAEKEITINLVVDGKPTQFALPAKPLDGEPGGQSSRFELADKTLAETLDAKAAKGRLKLTIGGTEFTGEIEHAGHDEHK